MFTWRVAAPQNWLRPLIKSLGGDGSSISLWHVNWHPKGSLHQKCGQRIVYDSGSIVKIVLPMLLDQRKIIVA